MAEKLKNASESILDGAIDASQTTITVGSAATFPTSGDFRIMVESEIMKVTAVSGEDFTVVRGQEGTTGASHADGERVVHLITKGALDARISDRIIRAAYSSKPAAGTKGRLFFPTDGIFMEYDDGSAWHKYGPFNAYTEPPSSGWTATNQGSGTFTAGKGHIEVADLTPDATNPSVRLWTRTAPGTPYTVEMSYMLNGGPASNMMFGFVWRTNSGGAFQLIGHKFLTTEMMLTSGNYASVTSRTGEGNPFATSLRSPWSFNVWHWKFQDDGTNKKVYISLDGINYLLCHSEARTTFNTPDEIGVGIDGSNATGGLSASLVHWKEY